MCLPDGAVDWLTPLLGESWGGEVIGDGVDRLGVRHLGFFSLVADCRGDQALAWSLGVRRPTSALD